MRLHLPLSILLLASLLLSSCNFGRPHINGGDQPIMDGWTLEQASEFWLASVLTDDWVAVHNGEGRWMTADEIAKLSKGHVGVDLPTYDSNPMPLMNRTYRQASTGGHITFRDTLLAGDTLHTIAVAEYEFREPMYFQTDSLSTTALVQKRGKGILTLYAKRTVRNRETGESYDIPEWKSAVISVYPGGDSLLVSRGRYACDAYVLE